MQLIFNEAEFNVISFTETLSFYETEAGVGTAMDLMINISYADSLETLIPVIEKLNFNSFSIKDAEVGTEREYSGFAFNGIDQSVSGFHQIATSIRLVKKSDKDAE